MEDGIKIGKMKLQLSMCSITLFLCQLAIRHSRPLTVPEFNRKVNELFVQRDTAIRTYLVEGYFTNQRGTILISDYATLRKNFLFLDSMYIPLQGQGIDSIMERLPDDQSTHAKNPYEGAFVRVRINARVPFRKSAADTLLAKKDLQLTVDQRPMIIRGANQSLANINDPVQLLDASCEQAGNGFKSPGMAREFLFKLLIKSEASIGFDSVWINHRCFKTYVANNRQVISNVPIEIAINDTITVKATAIGPQANRDCPSPTPYKGEALLRVLVDGKPHFIVIRKIRETTIYNRL